MMLVIFPGGGSPYNESYSKVYDLLVSNALKFGYDSVDISIKWPGHSDPDGGDPGSRLTLDRALDVAGGKIRELETSKSSYHILGRSFGTFVAVKLAIELRPKNLKKLILWGPPPYWLIWEMYVRNLSENTKKAAERGLFLDNEFFPSIVPLESMIGKLDYPTIIATGTIDPYSKPQYLQYLKSSFADENQKLEFRKPVENASHEVHWGSGVTVVSDYLEVLFK